MRKHVSTGAIVGTVLVLGTVLGIGLALASSKKEEEKKPVPPPPPPSPPARWERMKPDVTGYVIPTGTTVALAMADGPASRTLLAGYHFVNPDWIVVQPGAARPTDWPPDDQENPFAVRGKGSLPFPTTLPAGAVLAVWQWIPAVVGTAFEPVWL